MAPTETGSHFCPAIVIQTSTERLLFKVEARRDVQSAVYGGLRAVLQQSKGQTLADLLWYEYAPAL